MTTDNPCPGCGLAVPSGYPRCPRCHAAMPSAQVAPPPRGGPRDPGGTSLAEGGGRGPTLLIGAIVLAVVVAVVAVVILMRDGGDKDEPPAGRKEPAARPSAGPASGGPAEPSGPAEPDDPADPAVAPSATALAGQLDDRRLWATVETEGNVAVVHTAYCADPGMNDALAAAGPDLYAAGIRTVRCHERHGPLVFERPVSR